MQPEEVLKFWFEELSPRQWYAKNAQLDRDIHERFISTHHQAATGELFPWRKTIQGRLAEVIVLDQFSRNMFRDLPESFAFDPLALILAQEAVATAEAEQLPPERRAFLYLPYMHSESLLVHERALELFSQKGLESNLDFEKKHLGILKRFGRYPHRNAILGRKSTPEEEIFLQEPGSSF